MGTMATQVRHPIWLPVAPAPGASTFALLYALESAARALVASVIPIQAYELLQSEQRVSVLYTVTSFVALSATLLMPLLIERLARRWVYTLGAGLLMLAAVAFSTLTLPGQMLGMASRSIGAGALAITLNLYIMDHIRKAEFVRVESLRMAWSMLGWTAGPAVGVFLYTRFGIYAVHGASALFSLTLLAFFWWYRLTENSVIRPGPTKPGNPLANVGRFVSQPRLRLAWLIAFGRSCFWTTFFVYGPILMLVTGQGRLAGGLLVSAGNALLFTAILWGRAGNRFGARRTMACAFVAMAVCLFAAGAAGEELPLLAAGFLLLCTFFAIALDALGSSAFLRAVRFHERARMTAVYRTYLDLSDLLPPLVYSIVLSFFGIGATFVTLGVFTVICGLIVWRYLPRSM